MMAGNGKFGVRTVCAPASMCLEHVLYPSDRNGCGGGRRRKRRGERLAVASTRVQGWADD